MFQNPLMLMNQLQNSHNPMQLIQTTFGNNPIMQKALQMSQGKNSQQIYSIIQNIAKERGMNDAQLSQFLSQLGLRI